MERESKEKVTIKKIDLATFTNDKYLQEGVFDVFVDLRLVLDKLGRAGIPECSEFSRSCSRLERRLQS
jgi:hypothetical protein